MIIRTRYYKDALSYWKFEEGRQPQVRTAACPLWWDSDFNSLEEFLAESKTFSETTAEEAELDYWAVHPPSRGQKALAGLLKKRQLSVSKLRCESPAPRLSLAARWQIGSGIVRCSTAVD